MALTYKDFLNKLSAITDIYQAEAELNLILETVNFSKTDFLLGKTLSEDAKNEIDSIINTRIEKRIPIQQILGYGYFMGEKFNVTPDVLIPRPETELLVQEIIKLEGKSVLDIGSGTGCIAIMINKLSNKDVISCDISEKALKVAQENAQNLHAEVKFVQSDLFQNIDGVFDIIVSNPPYIPKSAIKEMQPEVVENEPHLALFTADEEGIEFYKKIIEQSHNYLNSNGYLAFELGIKQSQAVEKILCDNNFGNIKIIKDFGQIERIIIAQKL